MEQLSPAIRNAIEATVKTVLFPYSYYNRRKLVNTAKQNEKRISTYIKAAEATLTALSRQYPAQKGLNIEFELASASFYAATLSLDLNSAVWIAATSWRKEKREYIWRTIALTLYEGISQYQQYVLPALSKFLTKNDVEEELLLLHKSCAKKFSGLSRKYSGYLYAIRNNCIAHREVDYGKFKAVRASVSELKIMACLTEFMLIQAETQQVFGASFKKALDKLNKN